jgi:hypothetical protein
VPKRHAKPHLKHYPGLLDIHADLIKRALQAYGQGGRLGRTICRPDHSLFMFQAAIIHFDQNKRVNEMEVNERSEVVTDC